jgi:hypothetical protein
METIPTEPSAFRSNIKCFFPITLGSIISLSNLEKEVMHLGCFIDAPPHISKYRSAQDGQGEG